MRKKFKYIAYTMLIAVVLLTGGLLSIKSPAHAATFNSSDLIDDTVFNNSASMSAAQINSFVNAHFPNSCISTNTGFSAPDPTGYSPSGGFTYGGNVSSGQVISDAAQAYGLNPQVLLVTMEKEQSLVSGGQGCTTQIYSKAMGYACPDSGGTYSYSGVNLYTLRGNTYTSVSGICVNKSTDAGFSQQVIHAAWLLKFAQERSEGNVSWDAQSTNFPESGDVWNNSYDPQSCYSGPMTPGYYDTCPNQSSTVYYDGYTTIDGVSTLISTGGTAALYDYTPHFSGNKNFDNIFINWFGNIYGSVTQYEGQSGYPSLQAGQSTQAYIKYQNTGDTNWYDTTDASANGVSPVTLAVTNPINAASPFSWGWPSSDRPANTFAAVYNSDGTTLASNQHVVTPNEIVEFSFNITVPYGFTPGQYTLYVQPVLDGAANWGMGGEAWWNVNVVPTVYSAQFAGQSNYPTIDDGQVSNSYLEYKNTGNVNWYDTTDAAANGAYPVNLATTSPINRGSMFSWGWPSGGRPATTFADVYNSDGTTLASNQHVVTPGEIAKFAFTLTTPWNLGYGTYTENFQPILDGSYTNWNIGGQAWLTVTVPSVSNTAQYMGQSGYPTLSPGQSTSSFIEYKNTGTNTWYDSTSASSNNELSTNLAVTNPINSASSFSWGWPSNNRASNTFADVYNSDGTTLASNQHQVTPGEIVKYTFNITVPYGYAPGKYSLYVQPVLDGAGNWNLGGTAWFNITVN